MLFKKKLNSQVLKFLSISLLVAALIVSPSLSNRTLQLFSGLPVIGSSVQTSTLAQPKTTFKIAQAPTPVSEEANEKELIDFFAMTMGALAGLVLFIYGVTRLSEGLGDMRSDCMKNLLAKCTTNRFAGVATGTVATTLLESSSVTIIMVIAMVSAGVLTFVQSLGVVLGSNIGTAVGAQIISLDINKYVPILMFAGLLLLFVGKGRTLKNLGIVLLGFGLMFYGLEAIDEAMKPFREYQPFIDLMQTLAQNPLLARQLGQFLQLLFNLPPPQLQL